MNILVTGATGFIGFHLSKRLLAQGYHVIGVDNMNGYYDVLLKKALEDKAKEMEKTVIHKIALHPILFLHPEGFLVLGAVFLCTTNLITPH